MDEGRSLARWRALGLVAVLVAAVAGSYIVSRGLLASGSGSSASALRSDSLGPPSGKYLVAYVMVSSRCAACRDERTRTAIGSLRDSLRSSHSAAFAKITVVGVGIDGVEPGVKFLRTFGPAFDELVSILKRSVCRHGATNATSFEMLSGRVDCRRGRDAAERA